MEMDKAKVESPTALVWRHAPSQYNGTALLLLLKIAGLSSAKDGHAHVRMNVLAAMCGVKERQAQRIIEGLKADGFVKVRYRKGKSSIFILNHDAIRSLPLAVPPEERQEAPTPEQQEAEPEKASDDAKLISGKLSENFTKMNIEPPADWQTAWPADFRKLLDAGHSVDFIRDVTRFALTVEAHRAEIVKNGPAFLVRSFALLKEQAENFGKVAA
jgi:hypothetical protein